MPSLLMTIHLVVCCVFAPNSLPPFRRFTSKVHRKRITFDTKEKGERTSKCTLAPVLKCCRFLLLFLANAGNLPNCQIARICGWLLLIQIGAELSPAAILGQAYRTGVKKPAVSVSLYMFPPSSLSPSV